MMRVATARVRAGLFLLVFSLPWMACNPPPPPPNQPPVADAGGDRTIQITEEIVFDASGSSDPDGELVEYRWDLGDGTTSEEVSITHVYAAAGGYIATLTVTDDDGETAQDEVTVTVEGGEPLPSVVITPEVVNLGDEVTFDASGSTALDPIVSYDWTFGDGGTASGVTVTHTYPNTGTYQAVLTIEDEAGRTGELTGSVEVLPLDVGGVWNVTAASPSFSCQSYAVTFVDTVLTLTMGTDGALTATTNAGREYSGTITGAGFTMSAQYIGETGAGCISAPVNASFSGSFQNETSFTANVTAFYDLSIGCQCSALFAVTGTKQ